MACTNSEALSRTPIEIIVFGSPLGVAVEYLPLAPEVEDLALDPQLDETKEQILYYQYRTLLLADSQYLKVTCKGFHEGQILLIES